MFGIFGWGQNQIFQVSSFPHRVKILHHSRSWSRTSYDTANAVSAAWLMIRHLSSPFLSSFLPNPSSWTQCCLRCPRPERQLPAGSFLSSLFHKATHMDKGLKAHPLLDAVFLSLVGHPMVAIGRCLSKQKHSTSQSPW